MHSTLSKWRLSKIVDIMSLFLRLLPPSFESSKSSMISDSSSCGGHRVGVANTIPMRRNSAKTNLASIEFKNRNRDVFYIAFLHVVTRHTTWPIWAGILLRSDIIRNDSQWAPLIESQRHHYEADDDLFLISDTQVQTNIRLRFHGCSLFVPPFLAPPARKKWSSPSTTPSPSKYTSFITSLSIAASIHLTFAILALFVSKLNCLHVIPSNIHWPG